MSQITNHIPSQKSLKIAIIAHSLYPIAEPYAGGLEMITQLLCDELVKLGHTVTLYAHKDSETQATLRPFMSREAFEQVTYPNEHESLGMTRDELYQHQLYQDAMREIIEGSQTDDTAERRYDVVHNHSLHYVPMLTGQALGKRMFTTFHTPIFPQLRLALLTLMRGTTTQFTTISGFQQRLYDEFVPLTVVYNGIDVDSFTFNTAPIKQESYFWFGRICPEKGTHLAMQYCLVAGKRLVIAGPKSNQDYFDTKVAPLLAKDNISAGGKGLLHYVGHLSKPEVNEQLIQSTAMLFTSTWEEPYGLTLAESLACGTPVIGFDVGASSEIITDKTGIIVDKLDQGSFVVAFDKVQSISRQACRERAEQFCSGVAMVDGYLALYYKALINDPMLDSSTLIL
ncbi:MAG: glycosyltransferase [Psychrobacter sp.]|nr:glycosyltransferase [Psychrobacter sp.]